MAYISAAESIRVSSPTITQSTQKATELGEITQPLGLLRRSRSFKVTDFGTNRKLIYDFLLVINTKYLLSGTVSKLWLIIGQIFASEREVPHFNALAG